MNIVNTDDAFVPSWFGVNPAAGGSTACILTLASPLPADGSLLDTVTGPAGTTITKCGSGTGGLACGKRIGVNAIALCAPTGAMVCATGASLTLTIQSSGSGALSKEVGVTAQRGHALIQFPITPNPPVAFGP